ncbi:MAG: DUF4270 family protein [Cytophagales bacterium]|nr:DUF4270 family protein [Cytophaga sp.]
MKRNIITSIINWWAKRSLSVFFTILIPCLLFSCKKEGNFNLGNNKTDSEVGVQYDTTTLINYTLLLNDSLISAQASYLAFGGYSDSYTGKVYAEAYTSVRLYSEYVDYTGAVVDSANLYMFYTYAYGDTTQAQDVSVYTLTTQLDKSVPYRTTTDFVTYDPAEQGTATFKAKPYKGQKLRIPLNNTFATSLLGFADDKSTQDFQSSFYGIVIKAKNNSKASVVTANYTNDVNSNDMKHTRLIVYFKRGGQPDSASFTIMSGGPAFNKIYSDRTGTDLSALVKNRDSQTAAATNKLCYVQSGIGIVTKIEMPNIYKYKSMDGSSVIVNKAQLVVPINLGSSAPVFRQVPAVVLLEMNPDNTYKYGAYGLSYIYQAFGQAPSKLNPPVSSTATSINQTSYKFDITSYIQAILTGKAKNEGFIITPTVNAYLTNRSVMNSSTSASNPMKLEIYYTKVK